MTKNILLKCITIIGIITTIVSGFPISGVPIPYGDALTPEFDPFYKPTAGFEKEKPGTVLAYRILDGNSFAAFSIFTQNLKSVYQFLYRSTDALGAPTATVTTLLVPNNADPSKLVSFQTAEDSPTTDCAPSYSLRKGANLEGLLPQVDILLIDALLGHGYYVNTPDYEGPGSFYTVGRNSGNGVLDSIRAVLSSGTQTQLQPDAKVQLWGYSGGAIATGWAVQLQASYAPELKIIGAAMGGTPVNLKAVFGAINKSVASGLAVAGVHGLSGQYPEFAAYVDKIIKPEWKQIFMDAKNHCAAALVSQFALKDIQNFVIDQDFMNNPVFTKIVPLANTEEMYNSWCSSTDSATSIEFVKDALSEHVSLSMTGAASAMEFLINGFSNVGRKSGCSKRTTASSVLDPSTVGIFGKITYDGLKALIGAPIGPGAIL